MKITTKFIYSLLFILLIFSYISQCFADDYLEESEDDIDYKSLVTSASAISTPDINSRSAIILERSTGAILFGKNELTIRKMASTTKIMTAIVVLENENDLSNIVTVSNKAAGIGGSRLGLSSNCKITVLDLLYGLMLCSGNDAAVALAEYIAGSVENFAELMNAKALSLGLTNTHFVTPHGLDNDDHYTTAYELACLTNYALQNEILAKIVKTSNYTVTINNYSKNLHNTNELLGNLNGIYGVKTGFTNGANRCLVTACKRGDLDIICIVLGADTKKFRTQDSIKLIEYAFANFEMINLKNIINSNFNDWKTKNLDNFYIDKAISSNIDVYLEEIPYEYYPINKNNIEDIQVIINCNYNFIAPLPSNYELGNLTINIEGENVCAINIYNSYQINKKRILDYFKIFFRNYTKYLESMY